MASRSTVDRRSVGAPLPQFGKHLLLGQAGRPGRSQLVVRLVDDGLPVAPPFESHILAQDADGLVLRGIRQVLVALEDADIEGDAEIVIGVPPARVGDDGARCGAALGVEGVLLLVAAQAADDLDRDSRRLGLLDQSPGNRLDLRQQRGDGLLAPGIDRRKGLRRLLAADLGFDQPLVDGSPRFGAGFPVNLDSELGLNCRDHFVDAHGDFLL